MADIVERLLKVAPHALQPESDLLDEAVAEIARLRAEAAAARIAGWRAGREAAAVKADEVENEYWSAFDGASATGARKTASAIRAIPEPKEPTDA